jgi:hypothetical protein
MIFSTTGSNILHGWLYTTAPSSVPTPGFGSSKPWPSWHPSVLSTIAAASATHVQYLLRVNGNNIGPVSPNRDLFGGVRRHFAEVLGILS